ncbi:hypothetical protein M422DRAFT_156836 [Sphaerobolus stellatus SS14]|uniref:Uncharacterized protein n=1 Tax=Sphaerobolus stellatus (strain SS14) TaxID=990650 RepID=A0A0C9T7J6_SPHS4|nr:hypothetical protein M422DRAFT_194082 [Sphaerobolus stellatus SS14]KIJ52670.1 hypothetical protein M422DRAFT_156836 [Sphaerobolus stellatus SS14]
MQSTETTPLFSQASRSLTWTESVPLRLKPYIELARIDSFIGNPLIFWPCAWGLTLSTRYVLLQWYLVTYAKQLGIWLLWSILLHSVGSIWNDICDINVDRQVERTKSRPLPSGKISIVSALLFMIPQVLVMLLLLFRFNDRTILAGLIQLFFFTPLFPLMKRITALSQVWLGLTFAWGVIGPWLGNLVIVAVSWQILSALVAFGTVWITYSYTLYAMVDRSEHHAAGIKSTALLLGEHGKPLLSCLAGLFVIGLAQIGVLTHQGSVYFLISVCGGAAHLVWQMSTIDLNDPVSCMARFKSNGGELGYVIWIGMLLDSIFWKFWILHGLNL